MDFATHNKIQELERRVAEIEAQLRLLGQEHQLTQAQSPRPTLTLKKPS